MSATRYRRRGYAFWGVVFGVIFFLEIFAAFASSRWAPDWMGDPEWLTISSTVSHLEDQWAGVAVLVLGILTATAFYSVVEKSTTEPTEPVTEPTEVNGGYSPWTVLALWVSTLLLVFTVFGPVRDILSSPLSAAPYQSDVQYRAGYAIYGLIAFWGIVVPLTLEKVRPAWLGYPNAFATVRNLGKIHRSLTVIVLAGLAVLAIHLVLYPWPNLSREATGYAGLSRAEARELVGDSNLDAKFFRTSEVRGHIRADYDADGDADDVNAWLIYFNEADFPAAGESGCVVAVWTDKRGNQVTTASSDCR